MTGKYTYFSHVYYHPTGDFNQTIPVVVLLQGCQ